MTEHPTLTRSSGKGSRPPVSPAGRHLRRHRWRRGNQSQAQQTSRLVRPLSRMVPPPLTPKRPVDRRCASITARPPTVPMVVECMTTTLLPAGRRANPVASSTAVCSVGLSAPRCSGCPGSLGAPLTPTLSSGLTPYMISEPTSGLSTLSENWLWHKFRDHAASGVSTGCRGVTRYRTGNGLRSLSHSSAAAARFSVLRSTTRR